MRPAETLRVITRQSDGIPLPGTTVIARDRLGRECAVITDGTGAASFDLAPGDVVIKTLLDGYASHRRLVTVRAEQVCVVEVFSGFTVEDEITVCC